MRKIWEWNHGHVAFVFSEIIHTKIELLGKSISKTQVDLHLKVINLSTTVLTMSDVHYTIMLQSSVALPGYCIKTVLLHPKAPPISTPFGLLWLMIFCSLPNPRLVIWFYIYCTMCSVNPFSKDVAVKSAVDSPFTFIPGASLRHLHTELKTLLHI